MIASLILILHFLGLLPQDIAVTTLYIAGILLIIAEIGVASLGVLALNGLLALYAAYALQNGATIFFGVEVGWGLFFGIAAVELAILLSGIYTWKRLKRIKTDTGAEGMIGRKAAVLSWSGRKGRVQYEGEAWQAVSEKDLDLAIGEDVLIRRVDKLKLVVEA